MKSAGNTPFLKILIIVFEYQQVLSTGFTTLGILSDAGRHNANDADEMISANKRESYGRKMYGKNQGDVHRCLYYRRQMEALF